MGLPGTWPSIPHMSVAPGLLGTNGLYLNGGGHFYVPSGTPSLEDFVLEKLIVRLWDGRIVRLWDVQIVRWWIEDLGHGKMRNSKIAQYYGGGHLLVPSGTPGALAFLQLHCVL